jgi:tetratricopeptide (TPR) repeat protein
VVLALVILWYAWVGTGETWGSERSDIYRQSRSAAVLLVSVDRAGKSLSFGTGFFMSQDGHILTNAHVLAPSAKLLVYVPDQGVFTDAKTVTIDQDADLAVLRLPSLQGRALPLAGAFAEEGTEALAVGFPRIIDTLQMGLTLHSTVKPVNISGVAMGRSRTQGRIIPFIQASGVVHAGTSGGPLVDAVSGQVLGMVVHSVPYVGQATDRHGSLIGSVLLRADMSYAIPATFIRQWLLDHQISYDQDAAVKSGTHAGSFPRFQADPQMLGMSLFLTGHLVQTIADTVNSDAGFMELAVYQYEKAHEHLPGKTAIARNLALAYGSLHRYQEALNTYEGLLRQSPSDFLLLTETAQTLKLLQKEEQAMTMYRSALEQEACHLDALNGLGNLYLSHQEYGKAVHIFRQAVKCAPSSAYASFYLGESMTRSGLVEEAHAVWKNSLERVSARNVQEQELFNLMRERTVNTPALLSHATPVKLLENPKTISH